MYLDTEVTNLEVKMTVLKNLEKEQVLPLPPLSFGFTQNAD